MLLVSLLCCEGPHQKKTGKKEEVRSTKICSVVENSEKVPENVDAISPSLDAVMETNECECVCVCVCMCACVHVCV